MKAYTKRELNQNTAAVLSEVTETTDVVVSERGQPRWRVRLIQGHDTVLERLEREGRYRPPAPDPAPWPAHAEGSQYTSAEIEQIVDDMRGDH